MLATTVGTVGKNMRKLLRKNRTFTAQLQYFGMRAHVSGHLAENHRFSITQRMS
jgi:hypothetical protein